MRGFDERPSGSPPGHQLLHARRIDGSVLVDRQVETERWRREGGDRKVGMSHMMRSEPRTPGSNASTDSVREADWQHQRDVHSLLLKTSVSCCARDFMPAARYSAGSHHSTTNACMAQSMLAFVSGVASGPGISQHRQNALLGTQFPVQWFPECRHPLLLRHGTNQVILQQGTALSLSPCCASVRKPPSLVRRPLCSCEAGRSPLQPLKWPTPPRTPLHRRTNAASRGGTQRGTPGAAAATKVAKKNMSRF